VIGDTSSGTADVRYQVLCRRHYRAGDLGQARQGGAPPDGEVD